MKNPISINKNIFSTMDGWTCITYYLCILNKTIFSWKRYRKTKPADWKTFVHKNW